MSDESLDDVVVLEHRGDVSVVRFNRPDRMNALSSAGWLVFEQRMLEADAEPTTGAIVVTGTGRAFCAGGDVSTMAAKQEPAAAEARRRAPAWRVRHDGLGLVNTMLEIEKPTLAALNGAAVGIGATVALLCDQVLMARTARIGDSHVPLGIVAGDGAIAVLPLLIGVHRAKELLLTGRLIDGAEALAMGLVAETVELSDLESFALARAGSGHPTDVRDACDQAGDQPRAARQLRAVARDRVRLRRVVDGSPRTSGSAGPLPRAEGSQRVFVRSIAQPGSPPPAVTTATSASVTWRPSAVPRSCCIAS